MRITDAIRGEHAAMRPLLRHFREATKPGAVMVPEFVKANATTLKKIIQAHASIEDALLFERWKKFPVVRHALREHREIEELLDQAITEGDQKVLNHAIRLALGHFAEEERDVFPLLEKELSKYQLAQLGLDWAQLRGIKLQEEIMDLLIPTDTRLFHGTLVECPVKELDVGGGCDHVLWTTDSASRAP